MDIQNDVEIFCSWLNKMVVYIKSDEPFDPDSVTL